ncbi:MFS general substrate transporter [Mycena floridula]|nr:MFS general substrate transporter [Mycena floridula]
MTATHDPSNDLPVAEQDDKTPGGEKASNLTEAEEPYSVYTRREKWFIVGLSSYAGLFSPLTANIYFPAIPTLVVEFKKSTELINLTVTMYMIFQALSPMVFGSMADTKGRRPMFISCLAILTLTCVGLALVPTSDYWLLMVLRGVQAAGSASTVALGAGVIGDIAVSAERAGFFGLYTLGPMFGPAIGPAVGGALAGHLGWRSIFWFLCIAAGICLIILILLLPETLRAIVGNGSIAPPALYRPIITVLGRTTNRQLSSSTIPKARFRNPLLLLKNWDIVLLLFVNGVVAAVFFAVVASISTIFHETYPQLSETELGLCFLTIGGGMIFGSTLSGRLLDWDFQRVLKETGKQELTARQLAQDDTFPIEKARLRIIPFFIALYVASTVGYGWCIEKKVNIAGPLILLVGVGFVSIAVMNAMQTQLIDLVPTQSSSVAACSNLVRGALGASLVAVIDIIINAIGPGWTYVIMGGACILVCPLLYVIVRIGPGCRARRRKALEK